MKSLEEIKKARAVLKRCAVEFAAMGASPLQGPLAGAFAAMGALDWCMNEVQEGPSFQDLLDKLEAFDRRVDRHGNS